MSDQKPLRANFTGLLDCIGIAVVLVGIALAFTQCAKCQHDYDPMGHPLSKPAKDHP